MRPVSFVQFCELAGLHLEPGQRVHDLVAFDGAEPGDLEGADYSLARAIFGEVDEVPAQARAVSVQVKGRDVGGTRRGALRGLHLAVTAPLDRLDRDELAVVLFVGPKLRHARIAKRFALAAAKRIGVVIEAESADGFTIVRHDGRRVAFDCIAAARAGDTGRGVPVLFALLDEAGFFYDDQHEANGRAVFNGIVPRLLPGGQIAIVSSPWLETGLLHEEFERNHGKPRTALAAHCPTLVMRDDPDVRATVERETERDPDNARREFGAEFLPAGASVFLDPGAVRACAVDLPYTLPPAQGDAWLGCGFDPGFTRDASAGVIVRREPDSDTYTVVEVFERRPEKGKPLVPSAVVAAFAEVVKRHGGDELTSDVHYVESIREHARTARIDLVTIPGGAAGKVGTYLAVRDIVHAGRLQIPKGQRRLLEQLRELTSRPTPGGGMTITSPRRRGSHGDIASALVCALWRCDVLARYNVNPYEAWASASSLPRAPSRNLSGLPGRSESLTVRYRPQGEPPAGATGICRSPNGISYTDAEGRRRHIVN